IGEGGRVLRDLWSHGVITYLGAMAPGFPNFFMAGGPHLIAGNFPRATEIMVDYITGVLCYVRANGDTYVAPDRAACEAWTEEVQGAPRLPRTAETRGPRAANPRGKTSESRPSAGTPKKSRGRMAPREKGGPPAPAFAPPARP